MATITLPVASVKGVRYEVFEIDTLSFARSITRQGKGARKAWRHHLRQLRFPVIESDNVAAWNLRRGDHYDYEVGSDQPMHGIRRRYRGFHDAWAMIDGPTLKPGDPDDTVPPRTDDAPLPGADD